MPPLIGFAAYFAAVRFSSVYFTLRIDKMGEGTIIAFMAYFKFFWPLLLTVALLTQLLIVVPVWYKVFIRSKSGKFVSLLILCIICLLFAAGISYAIWDRLSSFYHVIRVCIFMTGVQLAYWTGNLFILYLLTKKPEQSLEVSSTNE